MCYSDNCLENLCDIADVLSKKLNEEITQCPSNLDANEAYIAADIIKDAKEAIYYTVKAEYYKAIIEAMNKGNDHQSFDDIVATTRKMWDDSDPEMKARIHKDLTALLAGMKL